MVGVVEYLLVLVGEREAGSFVQRDDEDTRSRGSGRLSRDDLGSSYAIVIEGGRTTVHAGLLVLGIGGDGGGGGRSREGIRQWRKVRLLEFLCQFPRHIDVVVECWTNSRMY